MRKLIVFLVVVVALVVVAVIVLDGIAVRRTESTISSRIEQRFPGSHATVTIDSSLFLVHLAASGTVAHINAHVTGVTEGRLTLESVDLTVHDLKVSRSDLVHGSVRLVGLSEATITVTVTLTEVLRAVGLGAVSGLGAIASGAAGAISSGSGGVRVTFGPISFEFPFNSLVPCVGSAHVSGTDIVLSCTTTTIPPALQSP